MLGNENTWSAKSKRKMFKCGSGRGGHMREMNPIQSNTIEHGFNTVLTRF